MCNRTQREVLLQWERAFSKAASTMMEGWTVSPQSYAMIVRRSYVFETEIRLWHWEVMPVSFSLSKYRSGREKSKAQRSHQFWTLECWLGPEDLIWWHNSDWRQGEWATRVLGPCPTTNKVPTVQPEVETVVKPPCDTPNRLTRQGQSLHSL